MRRGPGLRPGEKLFEELNHNTENHVATEHPQIMRFVSEPRALEQLRSELTALHAQSATMEASSVKLAIKQIVPEYQPQLGADE